MRLKLLSFNLLIVLILKIIIITAYGFFLRTFRILKEPQHEQVLTAVCGIK